MKKEFNLSDCIVEKDVIGQDQKIGYIHEEFIRKFIMKMKVAIVLAEESGYINKEQVDLCSELDNLAGDKLI